MKSKSLVIYSDAHNIIPNNVSRNVQARVDRTLSADFELMTGLKQRHVVVSTTTMLHWKSV